MHSFIFINDTFIVCFLCYGYSLLLLKKRLYFYHLPNLSYLWIAALSPPASWTVPEGNDHLANKVYT